MPVGETWARCSARCQGAQQGACSFPPAAHLAAPTSSVVVFPPRKYQLRLGRNTHDSVISRRIVPDWTTPGSGCLGGNPELFVASWVGGWAPLFVFEGPRPGCPLSTPGKVCPLVQRVGRGWCSGVAHDGLVDGGAAWDPPSPGTPLGWTRVDLVGTPGLMGVDGSDSLPLVIMGGPPKDPW